MIESSQGHKPHHAKHPVGRLDIHSVEIEFPAAIKHRRVNGCHTGKAPSRISGNEDNLWNARSGPSRIRHGPIAHPKVNQLLSKRRINLAVNAQDSIAAVGIFTPLIYSSFGPETILSSQ